MKTEIEIPVAELKAVLPGFGKVLQKTTLPVLGGLKFALGQDQSVRIQASNLDETVTARLQPCANGRAGEMIVSFRELAGVIKHCASADSVRLMGEGKKANIHYRAAGSNLERSLSCFELKEWPPEYEIDGEPQTLDDAFKLALKEALECAGNNEIRPVISGACLDVSNKEAHYVVGTNGRQLYTANSFLFHLAEPLIIPTGKFIIWPGFMNDGPWRLWVQPEDKKKVARFRIDSDHWTYLARPVPGSYPNWKPCLPKADANWTRITLEASGVKTVLEALPLLPGYDQDNSPVVLEVVDGNFLLKGKTNPDSPWAMVKVEAMLEGGRAEVSVNRHYLSKALRMGLNRIEIKDPVTPVAVTAKGKTIVMAPLNGKAAEKFRAEHETPSSDENSTAALPPAVETFTPAEPERNTMPEIMTAPPRGHLNGHNAQGNDDGNESALEEMIEQVGTMKMDLRKVVDGLQEVERLLRKAQKEHKATEKEIGKARSALRSLQSVEI